MSPLSSDRTGRDAVPDRSKACQAQSCALREARDFSRVRLHLFGESQYIYTFENTCKEVPGLRLGDDAYKIFVNAEGTKGTIPEELKGFLALMRGESPKKGSFANQIQEQVEKVKEHKEWRKEYMTLLMRDQENQEKGRREERINNIARLLLDPEGERFARVYLEATDEEIMIAKKIMLKQA